METVEGENDLREGVCVRIGQTRIDDGGEEVTMRESGLKKKKNMMWRTEVKEGRAGILESECGDC